MVDLEARAVTVNGTTYKLHVRSGAGWDVYEGTDHIGWFELAEKNGEPVPGTSHTFPAWGRVNVRLIAALWLEAHRHAGASPRPIG